MSDAFDPLIAEHEDFVDALLAHQEALVRGDVKEGVRLIQELAADLDTHIEHEETVLIPIVEEGGTEFRIGVPRYYREDHVKIRATLEELVPRTEGLLAAGDRQAREIALLIGREQSFRSLLEHHDEREQNAFFKDLRRLTTPEQRIELVAQRREPPVSR